MITHKLTTDQLKKLANAYKPNDWSKITNDPLVNYAIDCMIENCEYHEEIYIREANIYCRSEL